VSIDREKKAKKARKKPKALENRAFSATPQLVFVFFYCPSNPENPKDRN